MAMTSAGSRAEVMGVVGGKTKPRWEERPGNKVDAPARRTCRDYQYHNTTFSNKIERDSPRQSGRYPDRLQR